MQICLKGCKWHWGCKYAVMRNEICFKVCKYITEDANMLQRMQIYYRGWENANKLQTMQIRYRGCKYFTEDASILQRIQICHYQGTNTPLRMEIDMYVPETHGCKYIPGYLGVVQWSKIIFSNLYIIANWWCKPLIFQTFTIWLKMILILNIRQNIPQILEKTKLGFKIKKI